MIIIDSSAWIEFLRNRGDLFVKRAVQSIINEDRALLCGPVRLEVLGGARKNERKKLSQAFDDLRYVGAGELVWQDAVENAHILRDQGFSLPWNDILIATIARRSHVAVYSVDKHFALLKECLGLTSYSPGYNGSFNPNY